MKFRIFVVSLMCLALLGTCPAQAGGPDINKEAFKVAMTVFDKMLSKCGEYHVLCFEGGQIAEYKDSTFQVVSDNLSEADKLNGLEWNGRAHMQCVATRSYCTAFNCRPPRWNEWVMCSNVWSGGTITIEMQKKKGKWILFPRNPHPIPADEYTNKLKVDCKTLPGDATTPGPASSDTAMPPGQPPSESGGSPAACTDYDGCMHIGQSAFQSSDWSSAISDFQVATKQHPSNGEPWAWLGNSYLAAGRAQDAPGAWDKALQLGRALVFGVCHERGFKRCETGDLSLSAKEISFTVDGQKQLAQTPSQVTALGPTKNAFKSGASITFQVGGKNYNYDFFPFGTSCQVGSYLHCPEDGEAQQIAVRDYVSRTIPKLATGALVRPSQPVASPN